jgi:hypothetical protein
MYSDDDSSEVATPRCETPIDPHPPVSSKELAAALTMWKAATSRRRHSDLPTSSGGENIHVILSTSRQTDRLPPRPLPDVELYHDSVDEFHEPAHELYSEPVDQAPYAQADQAQSPGSITLSMADWIPFGDEVSIADSDAGNVLELSTETRVVELNDDNPDDKYDSENDDTFLTGITEELLQYHPWESDASPTNTSPRFRWRMSLPAERRPKWLNLRRPSRRLRDQSDNHSIVSSQATLVSSLGRRTTNGSSFTVSSKTSWATVSKVDPDNVQSYSKAL